LWLHSLKVAQLLRSAACLHTNQCRSYLNHLVFAVDFQVLPSLQHLFHLLVLFSVIKGLTNTAVLLMLDLWSPRMTVFVGTESSRWILSSAVTFAAAVLWFSDTVLFNVWRSLSHSFGFRPLFLLADDVRQWSVYVIINNGIWCSGYT